MSRSARPALCLTMLADSTQSFSQILSVPGHSRSRRAFARHGGFDILREAFEIGLAHVGRTGEQTEEEAQVGEVQRTEGVRLGLEVLDWATGDRESRACFEVRICSKPGEC
jgi:hypothetical protein